MTQRNFISAESGFTIIEVLIALAIFSIGFMAMGALQAASLMETGDIGRKTEAWTILEDQAETLKELPFYANDNGTDDNNNGTVDETDDEPIELTSGDHGPVTVDGRYDVRWEVVDDEPIDQQANAWTSSPANITVSKTITVTVTETGQNETLAMVEFVKTWAADGIQ